MKRSTTTTVLVEGLMLDAYVGQHAPEREQLQVVRIDISCTIIEPDVRDDDINNTFDYVPILKGIRTLATGRTRRLIETFAEEIADACLEDPHVQNVVVSIRKPNKFPNVDAVGITRAFERKDR